MNTTAAFADTVPAQWPAHVAAEPPTRWLDEVSNLLMHWLDASRSRADPGRTRRPLAA